LTTGAGRLRIPSRIVIDSRLSIDPDCRLARLWRKEAPDPPADVVQTTGNWVAVAREGSGSRWIRRPRLIVATIDPPRRREASFTRRGWEVWKLPARRGRVDLPAFSRRAASEGLIDILVESGPELTAGFLDDGPVDRLILFLAPVILGGHGGWGPRMHPLHLPAALRPRLAQTSISIGPDHLFLWEGAGGRSLVPPRDEGARNALESS
jgi:diaminohydroxyphosphoribosylaminopyrimidine deaminase/5-amino-6-(5-phosphoribosylamino)uracil reductase